MQRAGSIILLIVLALSLIVAPTPAVLAEKPNITPNQVTSDLNLTKGGGWFRAMPYYLTVYGDYIDEWGAVSIYRYPVSQFMGGYFFWSPSISPYDADGAVWIYSYAYETYTYAVFIFFDNYAISNGPTVDVVTDITSAPYNETYDVAYWVAVGYDIYAEYLNTSGIPVFYSGVYGELTDGNFFYGPVGPGYFDFDLNTARALFGGDTNVYGIALTSLAVANGVIYTSGFFVYNGTDAVYMAPILVLFNATTLSLINVTVFDMASYANGTFIPWRTIVNNGYLYIVGYREKAYDWTGWNKILDYIVIYKIRLVNATWPEPLASIGIQAFTGGYVGYPTHMIPYSSMYSWIGYMDKLDAVLAPDNETLYIAGQAVDKTGSWSAMVAAVNVTNNTLIWRNLIGSDTGVDFASGIDYIVDYKGDSYLVVTGSLNYTVSENLTGFNVFYALLNASSGDLKYLFVVGGNGVDLGFDLGQVVYYSPEGPVIRPYYTALTTNSTDFWLRNVTDLYNAGTLNTTSLPPKTKVFPKIDIATYSFNLNIKPAKGKSIDIVKIDEKDKKISISAYQPGNMLGGLLQPALPPATTLIVTHEPERAILWNDTTKYVLINITAQLLDNWTGNPVSGEEIWLYVSGPGINWSRNDTKITDATGTVQFQFNATQPGTYNFEVLYPGTAYYFRAFEFFQIFLSPYRTIAELYTNATSIYTLFEKPVKLSGRVYIKNGTRLVPFNHTTVIIDVYMTPWLSYLFFGDTSHTGWLWDQGFYIPDMVLRTNDTGGFEIVLTTDTLMGYTMYTNRSDLPINSPSYLFRAVVLANETIVTPENTSNTVQVFVNPTPTRIEIVSAPTNGTSIRVDTSFNVTARWIWSHDGFVTTHPVVNGTMLVTYNALDAGVTFSALGVTNASGEITFTVTTEFLGRLSLEFESYYNLQMYFIFTDAYTHLNYTVVPRGINVSVIMPPDSLLSIDNYKITVSVVDNETGEPKPDVAVWVFINGTAYGPFTTDETGTVTIVHIFPDNGFIKPGPMNLTVLVNGTANVSNVFVKKYDVTVGGRTEKIVNVAKTPTYLVVTYPSLVNATGDYQVRVRLLAKNSSGFWFEFTGATISVSTNYGFSDTVASGGTLTVAGTPDAGNYTLTISYPGSTYLVGNTTSYTVEAKWYTSVVINPADITVTEINSTHVKVVMKATVYRYYFNESAWKPMPGVTVKFFYVGSLVYFAQNTTDANGVAYGIGIVPRGEPTAFGAEATAPTIQPSSNEVSITQLPTPSLMAVVPLPELPVLPMLLLAAILLFIVLKKRK